MVTKDMLNKLVCCKDRDDVFSAVGEIPDEDLRTALISVVMLYKNSVAREKELWNREHERCQALERELEHVQNRLTEVTLKSVQN